MIADDLTGACGVAGDFARFGLTAAVCEPGDDLREVAEVDILVLNVESRGLNDEASAEANVRAARTMNALQPRLLIRKIDSLLRGPIGTDLGAILEALGEHRATVVAAVPAEGRRTLDGVQWVGDAPLRSSDQRVVRLGDRLACSRNRSVPIDLATVRRGPQAVKDAIGRAGDGLFVCDSATDADLRSALTGSLAAGIRVIACSYGVAAALLPALAAGVGPVLAVCGSVSRRAREQIQYASASAGITVVRLDAESSSACRARVLDALNAGRDVLLHTLDVDSSEDPAPDVSLESTLHDFAAKLVNSLPATVSGFAATGGATAQALLRVLGTSRISLLGPEAFPCAPLALLRDGPFSGSPFIVKPGAFGDVTSLVAMIEGARMVGLSRRPRSGTSLGRRQSPT